MYVCLCNGLTDRDIRRAADQGYCTVKGAYRALDAEINCGRCVKMAGDLIDQQQAVTAKVPQIGAE
jgi:bacterioferritin-associated ferredoxin